MEYPCTVDFHFPYYLQSHFYNIVFVVPSMEIEECGYLSTFDENMIIEFKILITTARKLDSFQKLALLEKI